MSEILASRTLSAFPLSVGTSLAFESLFDSDGSLPPIDPERVIPQRVKLANYDAFWINLATLYRNAAHSLQTGQLQLVRAQDFLDALMGEMSVIVSLMQQEGGGTVRPVFYLVDYEHMLSRYANTQAKVKGDSTELQKHYSKLMGDSLKLLLKGAKDYFQVQVMKDEISPTKLNFPMRGHRTLILTHVAYDLTARSHFSALDLIESHTGVLKKPDQFHTKYTNGKTLPTIPFMRGLLPVFGDSEMFSPLSVKVRNMIVDLAATKHWTPLTTRAKVLQDLDSLKDKFVALNIKQFFNP